MKPLKLERNFWNKQNHFKGGITMITLKIDRAKCICCGVCFSTSDLFSEDSTGAATVSPYGKINENNMELVNNIISMCPGQAISLVRNESKYKSYRDIVLQMRKKLEAIRIPDVTEDEVTMNANAYYTNVFSNVSDYSGFIYSSASKARRAALDAFEREVYSKYKNLILDIYIQYKVDKLRPYYTYDENGYYVKKNKEFEAVLNEFASDVIAYSEGKILLPKDFCSFRAFPYGNSTKRNDEFYGYRLANFEVLGWTDRVWNEYKSCSYSKVSDYENYIDTMDCWDGKGFFGDKYKYNYNSWEAVSEFTKDLKDQIRWVDTEEEAVSNINGILKEYREDIEKVINDKCTILEKAISAIAKN